MTVAEGSSAVVPWLNPSDSRVAPEVLDKVARLHQEHLRAAVESSGPLDLATVLREWTQTLRVRFTPHGHGGGSRLVTANEIDAMTHAAEHGYRLCSLSGGHGNRCWLPWGHEGRCLVDHGWIWSLAYGQPLSGVTIACTKCQPNSWAPAPRDCPHMGDLRQPSPKVGS